MSTIHRPEGLRLINSLTRQSRVIHFHAPPALPVPLKGFNIYRSDDHHFKNAVKLTAAPITVTIYEDPWLDRIEYKTLYYWVTAVDQQGNESEPNGPVWQEFEPYQPRPQKSSVYSIRKVADEIRRRHGLILRNDGEQGHYLCRKVAGSLAIDYDPQRRSAPQRSTTDYSESATGAYGTRFQGGYELFPNLRWRFIPINQKLTKEELGLTATRVPTLWVVDYPILQPRDIIVRQNNERYVITNVRPQSIGGRITRQVAELAYLEPENIIYWFPVPTFIQIPTEFGQGEFNQGPYGG